MILLKLFYVFFKIGLFSFGGGYVMLPMIYQDIQTFNIMPAKEFSDVVALSQMTPGPIAVNAATYVGYQAAGMMGSLFATIGVTLPCFLIILTIAAFLNRFKSSKLVGSILDGIRPATVGMISSAVIFFSKTSIFTERFFSMEIFRNPLACISIPGLIIFFLTLFASIKLKIGPITLTILAGILGAFIM